MQAICISYKYRSRCNQLCYLLTIYSMLYIQTMYIDVCIGSPTFQCATLRGWDGPGYEASFAQVSQPGDTRILNTVDHAGLGV